MSPVVPLRAGERAGLEVVVTWPDYDINAQGLGRSLARAGLKVRLEPKNGARATAEMPGLVAAAAGAIVSTDPFDATVLSACPALRVIARVGVGVDSIDVEAATRRGIAVTVTPGVNEESVADHTLALMLAALRRICEHDAGVRRGEWNRTGPHAPWLLSGAKVGLIGYGRTGGLVAERLHGFNVQLLVHDTAEPQVHYGELVSLERLLAESDVVSLHVPLLESTRGLIGEREFALMRPVAILVNAARGGVVEERALLDALRGGRLRAAALDVFEDEPPYASGLMSLPNVVLSPHIAGLSVQSILEMTRRATASVIDVLAGRQPEHLVNPEVFAAVTAPSVVGLERRDA